MPDMADIGATLYLKARERLDSSQRRVIWMVVATFLFHVAIFNQHVGMTGELNRLAEEQLQLEDAQELSALLGKDLEILHRNTVVALEDVTSDTIEFLFLSFLSLQAGVEAARTNQPGDNDDNHFSREMVQSGIGQLPPGITNQPFQLPETLAQEVRAGGRPLREILGSHITKEILEPAFDELNLQWDNRYVPAISEACASIRDTLPELENFPATRVVARDILEMINEVESKSEQIQFRMPVEADWWHSKEAKIAAIESLREGAVEGLVGVLSSQALSDDLLLRITAATKANKQLIENVQQQQEEARAGFIEQHNKIADLAKPLAFVAIDLDTLVGNFPFILAAFIAGALFWRSLAEREFANAYKLIMNQKSAASDENQLAILKPNDAKTKATFAWQIFGFGSAWVIVASAQLGFSETLGISQAVLVGVLGITVILFATWNHARSPE